MIDLRKTSWMETRVIVIRNLGKSSRKAAGDFRGMLESKKIVFFLHSTTTSMKKKLNNSSFGDQISSSYVAYRHIA